MNGMMLEALDQVKLPGDRVLEGLAPLAYKNHPFKANFLATQESRYPTNIGLRPLHLGWTTLGVAFDGRGCQQGDLHAKPQRIEGAKALVKGHRFPKSLGGRHVSRDRDTYLSEKGLFLLRELLLTGLLKLLALSDRFFSSLV